MPVNNDGMRIFKYLNRFQNASSFAFIFASAFILAGEAAQLISVKLNSDYGMFFYEFSKLFSYLLPYVFCYFLTMMMTDGKRWFKAFWSIICFALFHTAFSSLYDGKAIFWTGIIISFLCVFMFNHFDKMVSLPLTLAASIIFGLLFGYICEMWQNVSMSAADFISGKGMLSAVIYAAADTVLSLFDIDTLREMFFYKSYGGSLLIDENIVTGVKDLFSSGYTGELISTYMSGHYFMLFAFSGMAWALASDLKGGERTVLIVCAVCSVLSGNISLLLFFFMIESPFLLVCAVAVSMICFAAAHILDLGMGYLCSGGLIEMFFNLNHSVYLFAGGAVFVAIGYFVFKYSIEKHGISACLNIYIPSRLNGVVKSLGGIENIIRFRDDVLEVRNPKLINNFEIDCRINENMVKSDDRNFMQLKEYLNNEQ